MDIEKIKAQMDEIPFGNSDFQERHFTAGEESPSRRLRTVCINFDAKYKAMKEAEFKTRELLLDLEEKREQLQDIEFLQDSHNERAILRKKIEIERIEFNLKEQEKLIKDAAISMQRYYEEFESLPKMNRTEFEEAEHKYWFKRLSNEAQLNYFSTGNPDIGIVKSLLQIGFKLGKNEKNQLVCYPLNKEAENILNLIEEEKLKLEDKLNGSNTNG